MMLLESICMFAALLGALTFSSIRFSWFEKIEAAFITLARRRSLAVITVGVIALVLRVALLAVLPIPEPVIHDEFGYLLAAQTFAHGRLTNPTHPMWIHFESFGILQKPTYQCYAQPAQGLVLALGQVLLGHPFLGVCLSASLMCAVLCWALQAWMPGRWALLGGLLPILRYTTTTYWDNSYWGGAVGALGGALVLGALPRIKRSQRIRDTVIMAVGLVILANNRPFEGFVLSLPVAGALLVWMFRGRTPRLFLSLRRTVAPIVVVLAVSALWMGYYNWRVTGKPLQLAYQEERRQYAVVPYLLWQHPAPPPTYHDDSLRRFYEHDEPIAYAFYGSWTGLLAKLYRFWIFFLGPALTFPLLMAVIILPPGFSWKDVSRRTRFLLVAFGFTLLGMAAETFWSPHYMSPSTCVLLALITLAIRRLAHWRWRGKPTGLSLVRALSLTVVALFALRVVVGPLHGDEFTDQAWYQRGPLTFGRAALLKQLEQMEGQQLVIVRYRPDRSTFHEWVYNEADIDHSKVVWARELSPAQNQELIRYFHDRTAWLIEPDEQPVRLRKYPIQSEP
jgi:hypothetical protein